MPTRIVSTHGRARAGTGSLRYADAALVGLTVQADGRRVLRAARDGHPEIVVDANNEADLRGVAVFAGRAI